MATFCARLDTNNIHFFSCRASCINTGGTRQVERQVFYPCFHNGALAYSPRSYHSRLRVSRLARQCRSGSRSRGSVGTLKRK